MTLEEEAEDYVTKLGYTGVRFEITKMDFIAGANSNYVKRLVIEGKIEALESVLNSHNFNLNNEATADIKDSIKTLKRRILRIGREMRKQQLKELQ